MNDNVVTFPGKKPRLPKDPQPRSARVLLVRAVDIYMAYAVVVKDAEKARFWLDRVKRALDRKQPAIFLSPEEAARFEEMIDDRKAAETMNKYLDYVFHNI